MPEATNPTPQPPDGQPKPLKATLNLPQTAFPMKANLPQNEPARLAQWQKDDLYGQIRQARAGEAKYILHDGPPYANGAIHLGHALNKCIKDFVVKTKTMAGFDAPFVPGWDCHGLPIEIKVDEKLGRKKLEMPALAVRRACREYAQKYVDLQRSQFERIGVFGRWSDPYLTMSHGYEASIAETFFDFLEGGFVYKGLKPVFWCIHDKTALAEAEVEYEMHTSPSIYVRYKLTSDPAAIDPALGSASSAEHPNPSAAQAPGAPFLRPDLGARVGEAPHPSTNSPNVYTIIWTTTPWTLPASLAVAFNPELPYVALGNSDGNIYIVAEALAEHTRVACNLPDAAVLATFPGTRLDRATFQHPFLDRQILGVNADYVTTEQGTGAVHTAPSHGADDFLTGTRYGLSQLCDVDASGRLRNGLPEFDGLQIFEANAPIIELVHQRGALMGREDIHHSYPHCWRCHNPVIFRATEQWFISMETPMPALLPSDAVILTLREPKGKDTCISPVEPQLTEDEQPPVTTFRQRTLDEIRNVTWDPSWGEERISNMIATRPDWCISRQRIWGVPIAVFLCERCHTPLNDRAVNRSIVDLFRKEGADAWYTHDVATLLPPGTACKSCGTKDDFRKEMDILDVWFESGSSWHAVLDADPDLRRPPEDIPADLYTEGGDQHRGWFHSSLLTSVAVRGHAPYKMVATSGWTLDEQGRAFSKSLGNGVDPVDVANRLGAEVIRLWVASVDFREDVAASEALMQRVSDNYRKLRNTLRFLLGNLHDFDPSTNAIGGPGKLTSEDFAKLEPLDQYILARTAELDAKIRKAYDTFEFHRAYHALNEFVNTDLSALYLDVIKDRLYTFAPDAPARRSAQTALWRIAETLTRLIAPILSFTADEVWQQLPHVEGREPSVHLALFPNMLEIIPGSVRQLEENWAFLLTVREKVLHALEHARQIGEIGKGLDANVSVAAGSSNLSRLRNFEHALPEFFNVSSVRLVPTPSLDHHDHVNSIAYSAGRSTAPKCERCWRHVPDVGGSPEYPTVCLRCADALTAIHYPPYQAQIAATPQEAAAQ